MNTTTPSFELGLTTKEVAHRLQVKEQTIYNYVKTGELQPWNKDTWKMDGTYLFKEEEVDKIEKKVEKPGLTTKEIRSRLAEKNIHVSPSTVINKMKSGELPAIKQSYRNLDTYFVQEDILQQHLHLFKSNRENKTVFHNKKTGYFIFQSFKHKQSGELSRIVSFDGVNGIVRTENEEEFDIHQLEMLGYVPLTSLSDNYEINRKRGVISFSFPKPKTIHALTYEWIEKIIVAMGPTALKLEMTHTEISLQVKPSFIRVSTIIIEEGFQFLQRNKIDGELMLRPNGIVFQSNEAPFIAYGSSKLKSQIKHIAEQEGITQEQFIIQSLEEAIRNRQ
ncbi:helix-turn-helix domain-containing protein [Longirhabdus pacifica]|uniref:helix-turn-helix domain-containing protein n=1 Tax=Longirhabdus pacifica TaxID=2305227 RepID=UPI0013E8A724|nr:helix-turn-helix domain-containing protein [Longirhabdus pacifica]